MWMNGRLEIDRKTADIFKSCIFNGIISLHFTWNSTGSFLISPLPLEFCFNDSLFCDIVLIDGPIQNHCVFMIHIMNICWSEHVHIYIQTAISIQPYWLIKLMFLFIRWCFNLTLDSKCLIKSYRFVENWLLTSPYAFY